VAFGRKKAPLLPCLFLSSLLAQSALRAQDSSPTPAATVPNLGAELNAQVSSIFKRCRGAVVRVEAQDPPFDLVGTGFFVDPSGVLITSYSVAGTSTNIVVTFGDMKYPARRLTSDPRSGIALLKVEGGTSFPFLITGRSREMEAASPVMLIGYPGDYPVSPSLGLLAGFDIACLDRYFVTTHLRASVPIENGECGAPLVNMQGEVIGIAIAALGNKSGCYALPMEAAEKVRQDYARFGEVRTGLIGVKVDPKFTTEPGNLPRIESLVKDAPAEKSGLQPGDVIESVAGRKIATPADLLDASFFISPGEKIAVTVLRDGKEMPFTVQAAGPTSLREDPLEQSLPATGQSGVTLQTAVH
jgi:serine protease Do